SGPGERIDAPALKHRDLADHVRGRPEAVQAEPLCTLRERQRAVSDQAAAQQRRELLVGDAVGEWQAVALVGDGVLRVAAVDVTAGELRVDAQVLAAGRAVLT